MVREGVRARGCEVVSGAEGSLENKLGKRDCF